MAVENTVRAQIADLRDYLQDLISMRERLKVPQNKLAADILRLYSAERPAGAQVPSVNQVLLDRIQEKIVAKAEKVADLYVKAGEALRQAVGPIDHTTPPPDRTETLEQVRGNGAVMVSRLDEALGVLDLASEIKRTLGPR